MQWGDLRDRAAVARAVEGVEAVIHLAFVIPPASEEDPDSARAVNVEGTTLLVQASTGQPRPPRLLFASSFDVYGRTQSRPPPRRVDDPVSASDAYTRHKLEAEALITGSGLPWAIFRLSDVPVIGLRDPHPIMFEIGLQNRIEALHADDVAAALARALRTSEVWGRILLVGGGPSCQVTYGEYLARLLGAMGLEMLPAEAFSTKEYLTDWLDTAESQRLLRYQRRSLDDIAGDIAACLGWKRRLVPLAGPLVRSRILALSPYLPRSGASGGGP